MWAATTSRGDCPLHGVPRGCFLIWSPWTCRRITCWGASSWPSGALPARSLNLRSASAPPISCSLSGRALKGLGFHWESSALKMAGDKWHGVMLCKACRMFTYLSIVQMQTLKLVNTGLTGQLPVLWGVNGSFPSLSTLDASRNIISGGCAYYELVLPIRQPAHHLQVMPIRDQLAISAVSAAACRV